MTDTDLLAALEAAGAAADAVEPMFLASLGAPPTVHKDDGSFATQADLDVEERLRRELDDATGFPILGEEGGGPEHLASGPLWVVDPIDGTTNYANGLADCAILIALIDGGRPVASLTAMPVTGVRVTAAEGWGVRRNGESVTHILERPGPKPIAFGSNIENHDGDFTRAWRRELLATVGRTHRKLRISGSVGVDLALTAAGAYGAAVTFSPNLWDNAAGVVALREAGCIVTDLRGDEWRPGSFGVLAGSPEMHGGLLSVIRRIGPLNQPQE